ncbi:unnamed protein product, partial [Oncorhynchus mykiss]
MSSLSCCDACIVSCAWAMLYWLKCSHCWEVVELQQHIFTYSALRKYSAPLNFATFCHISGFKHKDIKLKYQTTANLTRPGRPSKLSAHTRRRLIRDAAKRPMITLDELQRSTAEVGDSVHRTTISRILHKSGLYGR